MPLEVSVIERRPVPDGRRFWYAVAGVLPRAAGGTAAKMQLRAPHGASGKLSRRVDVRVILVNQGLVQGVEAQFIVAVPYGHLLARGHRIIPRGPGRAGLAPATRGEKGARGRLIRGRRAELRSALMARRAGGAIGFVPADPFALGSLREDQGTIVRAIERGLTDAV